MPCAFIEASTNSFAVMSLVFLQLKKTDVKTKKSRNLVKISMKWMF